MSCKSEPLLKQRIRKQNAYMIERMMKTALMRKLVFRPCLPELFQREQWNTWSDWVFTSKRAILRHLCSLEIRPLFNTVYSRQSKIYREQCCDRWGEQLWMRFACFFFFFSRFYGFNWLHALVFDTTKSLRVWLLFVCLLNNCLLGSDWRPTDITPGAFRPMIAAIQP